MSRVVNVKRMEGKKAAAALDGGVLSKLIGGDKARLTPGTPHHDSTSVHRA